MVKQAQSDDLFQSLLAEADNPRLRQSLERVKEACDALETSRLSITPTAVGKYCDDRWKGPKAQSIRNAKDTLFAYLQARRSKQVLPTAAQSASYEPPIRDEAVRAYVVLMKSERDEAIRMKNRIIKGLRSIPGVPIDDLIASGFKPTASPPKQTGIGPEARGALARLFSEANLAAVGLELFRNRLRARTTKQVLLEKQDVEVLLGLMRDVSDEAKSTTPLLGHDGGQS